MTNRDITTPDGAYGFSLPDSLVAGAFERSYLAAQEQLQKSATLTVTAAIVDWSAKLGMTPEQWLEIYEPEVTLKPWQPGEDSLTLKLVVTAKVREGAETFTVKA